MSRYLDVYSFILIIIQLYKGSSKLSNYLDISMNVDHSQTQCLKTGLSLLNILSAEFSYFVVWQWSSQHFGSLDVLLNA